MWLPQNSVFFESLENWRFVILRLEEMERNRKLPKMRLLSIKVVLWGSGKMSPNVSSKMTVLWTLLAALEVRSICGGWSIMLLTTLHNANISNVYEPCGCTEPKRVLGGMLNRNWTGGLHMHFFNWLHSMLLEAESWKLIHNDFDCGPPLPPIFL